MNAPAISQTATRLVELPVQKLTVEAFAPFGQVLEVSVDGKPFGPDDAQLDINRGTPRFYLMELKQRPMAFKVITRHLKVTQCLASVGGKPWLLAVAPPNDPEDAKALVDPDQIVAFHVPGDVAVKLHRSAWHAGPFFSGPKLAFFNLELADTNKVDHFSTYLDKEFGREYRFTGPLAAV
jgi:ureidoglycolate hydrolase